MKHENGRKNRDEETACLLASLMMLLGSTAFAQNYTPGTYVGESGGRNGVVKVEAEYSADAIAGKVIEHSETPGSQRCADCTAGPRHRNAARRTVRRTAAVTLYQVLKRVPGFTLLSLVLPRGVRIRSVHTLRILGIRLSATQCMGGAYILKAAGTFLYGSSVHASNDRKSG